MAWNEPGNSNGKDPWGNNNRGGNQGPPDLDQALKQLADKINGLFGGSSGNGEGKGGSWVLSFKSSIVSPAHSERSCRTKLRPEA